MQRSYVKLFRDIQDTPVFANPDLLKVYLYCLLNASHKTRYLPIITGRGKTEVTIQKGELIWGRLTCGEKLNMKPRTAENHLKKLTRLGLILRKPYKHFTKITVLEMESETIDNQNVIENDGQPLDNHWTTIGQPLDTNKNVKNSKNKEKEINKEKENDPDEYTGGGSVKGWGGIRSLLIKKQFACIEADQRHCKTIYHALKEAIQQRQKNGGRPSDKQIFAAFKIVLDNLPDWEGYQSPAGIARNISEILGKIKAKRQTDETTAPKIKMHNSYKN